MPGTRSRFTLIAAGFLTMGCAHDAGLTSPEPRSAPESRHEAATGDGYGAPSYGSLAEVPPEHRFADVRDHKVRVDWTGITAESFASMEYHGNRGAIAFEVTVMSEYSSPRISRSTVEASAVLPAWRFMGDKFDVTVDRECDQTADVNATFTAKAVVFINTALTTIAMDIEHAQASDVQPDCTCGSDPKAVTEIAYDPYGGPDDGGGLEDGDCGGSGGGRTGKQYQPGDYTGGETVDWKTGQGNGGSSSCGAEAVVEYVCIEEWDGEKWVPWECGYATTC